MRKRAIPLGSIPGLRGDLLSDRVGLALLVARIARERIGAGRLRRVGLLLAAGENVAEQRGDAQRLDVGVELRGVAPRDVADLVAEHVGELGLGVGEHQQPTRYVDVAARQRERVRLVHLDDLERVGDVLARRVRGERAAERFDVAIQRGILREAHGGLDLPRGLHVDQLLVLRTHQHHLAAAGGGVHRGAAAEREREDERARERGGGPGHRPRC